MSWNKLWMGLAVIAGCAEGAGPGGGGSGYVREVRGGNLHHDPVAGVTMDAVAVDQLLRAPALAPALGELVADDFTTTTVTGRGPGGGPVTAVRAQQTVDGVPIVGAYLHLTVAPGDGGAPARLLGSTYHLFHGADLPTTPELDAGSAEARARVAVRAPADAVVTGSQLVIREVAGELRLVWDVTLADHHERALVLAAGPRAGRVELLDDRVHETRGTVRGWLADGGAPGATGVATLVPLPELAVTTRGASALTAGDGGYAIAAPAGATVGATLAGPAAVVVNRGSGGALGDGGAATARLDLTLGTAASGAHALAQVTAFHTVTAVRRWLADSGVDVAALGAPLRTQVNLSGSCNAYFSPADRSINFLRRGDGCNNSAEASIIAHEYGHFVDEVFGGIDDGGLSEGWGDVLACLARRSPVVGGDLFEDGSALRTCDNDYRYPAGGRDEVHELGQAWAGFVWHLRAGLIAAHGAARGDELTRALVLPVLVGGAPDIPSAVREVFLRDDDDGDLANHTPRWDVLMAAARRHGLGFVIDADQAPPATVSDLRVIATTPTSVTVRWTAPGDDGRRGTAARYDLRWSPRPITAAGFGAATPVDGPPPQPSGTAQELTLELPPTARVYLALRTSDELGNTSPLSNVATAELPAPPAVWHDGAEAGLAGWAASGLWHVTTRAPVVGGHAFRFGRAAGDDYDTGARATGTLTSPVIDLSGVASPRLALLEDVDVEGDADVDQLTIEVFDVAAPAVRVVAGKRTGHTGGLAPRLLDLPGLAGRRVRVRFTFDSVDGALNDGAGWALDELRVLGDREPPPPGGRLVINEVLADPPAGFDASGDGAWSATGDELIELVNAGTAPLDLSGALVSDAAAVRATLAAGTWLAPGAALVLFGGPAGAVPGGAIVVVTGGLALNNDGDAVFVRRPDGAVLAELRYGREGGGDQSLTRQRDGDPASPMVGHRSLAAAPASPGRRHDGSPFGAP